MNNQNNSDFKGINLSRQEIVEIQKASSAKKSFFRIKYGFKSLIKNPFKAIIALAYIVISMFLWTQREQLTKPFYSAKNALLSTITEWIFTIGILVLIVIFFLCLMSLFGTKLYWAKKAELAFISAGLYTRARKAPFLLDRDNDKETPVYMVWEIYLNGNTKAEFEAKKENIESELGITIHNFKSKGRQILLMYTTPDNIKVHKHNREDMDF